MSADWKIVNWASNDGSLSTSAKPRSDSCCLIVSMIVARLTLTVLLSTWTTPVSLPVRTATIWVCASRFASSHAVLKASDSTNLATASWMKLSIAFASGVPSACRLLAARGGRPRSLSAWIAWSVTACTCSRVVISFVIRLVIAACTAGSLASGATDCT